MRFAQAGIGAQGVNASADHDSGIEAATGEHCGHHAGGGGLAMHAGNGDAVFQAHQFGQHFRARDDRKMLGAGGGDFRVVRLDGGAGDHNVSASDVFSAVAFKGDGAEIGLQRSGGGQLLVAQGGQLGLRRPLGR